MLDEPRLSVLLSLSVSLNHGSTAGVLSMKWDGCEHNTPQHKGKFDMIGQGWDNAGELRYTQSRKQTLGGAAAAWSAFRIATGSSSTCPCETAGQHEGARAALYIITHYNVHLSNSHSSV